MRDVYISGIGMTVFTKQPDKTLKNLTAGAVNAALADAGIGVDAVERVFFGNAVAGAITRQEMVKGQILLRPLGFEGISITNVENACASASTALQSAWLAVASGELTKGESLPSVRALATQLRVNPATIRRS